MIIIAARGLEFSAGVQVSIGVKPTHRSVILVGSALGHHADDGGGIAPILGGEVVGQNANLLYGVRVRRQVGDAAARVTVGVCRVHHKIVGFGPLPVGI